MPATPQGGGGGGASVTLSDSPPADPTAGDLWWDTSEAADSNGGRLYLWYDDGSSQQWVQTSNVGGSGGGTSVEIADSAPTGASAGDLWWDSADADGGRLYIYYDDGDTQQWVEASPAGSGGGGEDGVRYQAGTWTPSTVTGDAEVIQRNQWSRVGDIVTVTAELSSFNNNGNIDIIVKGMPYVANDSSVGSVMTSRFNNAPDASHISGGDLSFFINGSDKNNPWRLLKHNDMLDANSAVFFSLSYQTDDTSFTPENGATVTTDIQGTGGGGGGGGGDSSGSGADAWGTVAADGTLRGGFNCTTERRGAGEYTVTFVTPMPNADYSVTLGSQSYNPSVKAGRTAESFQVAIANSTNTPTDFRFDFTVHASSTITPTYTWTRNGTTLEPANDGDDISANGNILTAVTDNLGPGSTELRPNGSIRNRHDGSIDTTYTYALYSGGNDPSDLSLLLRSNGQVEIGGSLNASRGISNPNITLNADGNGYFKAPGGFNPEGAANWGQLAAVKTYGGFGGGVALIDGTSDNSPGYCIWLNDSGSNLNIGGKSNQSGGLGGAGVALAGHAATSWTTRSDERDKENLVEITDGLDKVGRLRAVTGNFIEEIDPTKTKKAFLIAQDVLEVQPEAVSSFNTNEKIENQRYGVAYTEVIPLLVSALHDAKDRIEALEARLATLEGN